MRLLGINLENFRNIGSLSLEFGTDRIFFLGANGQGKSNLLEAIGVCSTLRSFRGASAESMIKEGESEVRLFVRFLDDDGGDREAMIRFGKKGGKSVEIDGEPVNKLGDLLGQFPSVCLSSRDFRLVRESPSDRRKWMDLVLSSTSSKYLTALQGYYRSMKERNTLLKKQATDSEIQAFEHSLASSAQVIQQIRGELFPALDLAFEQSYAGLSNDQESAQLSYNPDCSAKITDEWLAIYEQERMRDRQVGSTRRGPHRDDFSLLLDGRDSRHYASEGQQKGIVLALRVAEFSFLKHKLGTIPLLLADDVLGELDPSRRSNFRKMLPPNAQSFATGTSFPSDQEEGIWESFRVQSGGFVPMPLSSTDG